MKRGLLPQALPKFPVDLRDGETYDGVVVAADRVDQERALILDAVGAGLIHRRAGLDVALDQVFLHLIEIMEFYIGKSSF